MRWEKVDIGTLVVLRQGFAINKNTKHYISGEHTNLPLLRIADMKDETKNVFVKDTIPKRFIARPDDIIYTRTGQVGLVFTKLFGVVHNNCFTVSPIDEKVLSRSYLYYALKNKEFFEAANLKATGAAQPDLPHGAFNTIPIYLPPIETQHRIADILSAYDDLIENNRKQIKLLEEAAQRLYKEWFVDLRFPGHEHTQIVDGVPEGWEKKQLSDIVEVKYGKDHKSIPDGNVPVYGSGGLMRKCNQMLYKGESVLIPRKGSLNNFIYVDEAFWTVDTMFYTKMKWPNIGVFIYYFIKSFDMYAMNIGAAVPSMTTNTLNSINVIIPSCEILKNFQSTTKVYFRKIELLKRQIEMAAQARDRLLPKLMSGEVEE